VEARAALSEVYEVKESNLQTYVTTSIQQCKLTSILSMNKQETRVRLKTDRQVQGMATVDHLQPVACSQPVLPSLNTAIHKRCTIEFVLKCFFEQCGTW